MVIPSVPSRSRPRVLVCLKSVPSLETHNKSGMVHAFLRAHDLAGFDVVLTSLGDVRSTLYPVVPAPHQRSLRGCLKTSRLLLRRGHSDTSVRLLRRALTREHEARRFDLVFADNTAELPTLIGAGFAHHTGVPLIVREHRMLQTYLARTGSFSNTFRRALESAHTVLAVSPQLAELMVGLGLREEVDVLPNAIPDDFFIPPPGRSEIRAWAGDSFLFAGWTRWKPIKRLDLLLEAFAGVRRHGLDVRLAIAGSIEGGFPASSHAPIAHEDLGDHVRFLGHVDRRTIHELAHAADCCVVPSDHETFGLPAAEAIAAGTPAVVTRCGGPESIIDVAELGSVVPKGDPNALRDAMIDQYKRRTQFRPERLREIASSRYGEQAIAERLRDLYTPLLSKGL